jgi:hypothetical protein
VIRVAHDYKDSELQDVKFDEIEVRYVREYHDIASDHKVLLTNAMLFFEEANPPEPQSLLDAQELRAYYLDFVKKAKIALKGSAAAAGSSDVTSHGNDDTSGSQPPAPQPTEAKLALLRQKVGVE